MNGPKEGNEVSSSDSATGNLCDQGKLFHLSEPLKFIIWSK